VEPLAGTTLWGRSLANIWKITAMDNSTLLAADRATHAKIVAIALAASVAIGLAGMMARSPDVIDLNAGPVVKAGKPVTVTHNDLTAIR
jgi:hypothetical protein